MRTSSRAASALPPATYEVERVSASSTEEPFLTVPNEPRANDASGVHVLRGWKFIAD